MSELNYHKENQKQGWVSIYRSTINKSWYKKSEYIHLWVHLLLKSNHVDKEFWFNGKTIIVKKGSFITGRKILSDETGINESKIERILKTFENEQQIEQQKSNRNRIISVVSWDLYQQNEQQNEQQLNNKRTTTEQQLNTNNNNNNNNNINNDNKDKKETVFSFQEFWNVYPTKKGKSESEKKYDKLEEKDRLIIKNTINDFVNDKPFKDYSHPNPLTYINQKRWLDNVDEIKKDIPPFEFDFKKHGGDMRLFEQLKKEHELKYS